MKTSDLILLTLGAGLGYLVYKKYKKNKAELSNKNINPVLTKQAECEAKWNEKSKTMRLTQEALANAKTEFMLSCSPVLIATV